MTIYLTSYPRLNHRTTATTGDSMRLPSTKWPRSFGLPHRSPTVVHGPQTQLPIGGTRQHPPRREGGMMRKAVGKGKVGRLVSFFGMASLKGLGLLEVLMPILSTIICIKRIKIQIDISKILTLSCVWQRYLQLLYFCTGYSRPCSICVSSTCTNIIEALYMHHTRNCYTMLRV